jgi:predicted nuclease of predicted toxin-antitoxin system
MILADENIDHQLIEHLRSIGFEVLSVYESSRGVSDEMIIEISKNPPRIILTEDKDFGEWVYSHNEKSISVILLRYNFKETQNIIRILEQILRERKDALWGSFTTISSTKIRIRKIVE